MRVVRVKLTNWHNFAEIDVPLQQRTFLVGANASGKSNFLYALRFLSEVARFGLSLAVKHRGGLKAIRCLAARQITDVTVEVAVRSDDAQPNWLYRLVFNQSRVGQHALLVKEEVVQCDQEVLLSRPDEHDSDDADLLTQTHLEQVAMNKEFRPLAEALAAIEYLHVVPQLIREPEEFHVRQSTAYGSDLLERAYATSPRTRDSRLRRIQKALSVAVPQLESLEIDRDVPTGKVHLVGRYQHWRGFAAKQNERLFSDGTLRLFGLLWSLLDGKGPLLLEEPELSLHPGVVEYIPQVIARLARECDRQVIMSTHSSDLLKDPGIQPSEVLLFRPSKEGTQVVPSVTIEEVPRLLRSGLTMAEIVKDRTKPHSAEQLALFDR